jgi:Protein of unknown function (DUF3617)
VRAAVAAGAALLGLSTAAAAEPLAVDPGLWEVRTDAGSLLASGMLDKLTTKMSPEQRAMLEKMLSANVRLVRDVCVTRAMLDRGLAEALQPQRRKNCTATPLSSTATSAQYQLSCSGDTSGAGTVTLRAADPHNVTATADGTVTTKDGQSQPVHVSGEARWLGAGCGSVKPAG